jgi:D-alanyl-D-alanine carboxypeptidase (penicillin-binding protein 5/6)
LPKTEKQEVTREIKWKKNLTAPIKKGDLVGDVDIYVGENQVGSLPIVANEDIERLTLWTTLRWILLGFCGL